MVGDRAKDLGRVRESVAIEIGEIDLRGTVRVATASPGIRLGMTGGLTDRAAKDRLLFFPEMEDLLSHRISVRGTGLLGRGDGADSTKRGLDGTG